MDKKGTYIYEWPRPMVTVDALVFARLDGAWKLLLIKRANPPFAGRWAVPGGFIGIEEELEDAAARELAEETGLTGIKLEQLYTFGACGRDPRGRQITVAFLGLVDARGAGAVVGGDDAAEAKWFDIRELPPLAFDHARVTDFAIGRLTERKVF
jgi:8-oxo-dGTP diphosphatase